MSYEARPKLFEVGTIILYKLLPKDLPVHPERLWKGRVMWVSSSSQCAQVVSLDQGCEGLTEIVLFSQIAQICSQDTQENE